MSRIKRIILVMFLTIIFSINIVFAENVTENTTSSTNNTNNTTSTSNTTNTATNTSKNTTSTNTTTQSTAKSSNANLKNLGINPNDFSGFKENKTSYSVSVPNTVKSVEVYAKTKDSKAKVSGTGTLELKEGQNTASVVVTAEDGTKKTYTITITRLKAGEKVEKTKSDKNVSLTKIEIEGMNLEPVFDAGTFEYTVGFEGDQTSLDIKTESGNSTDIVQVIGNSDFIDGENQVTIMVSDASESKTVLYKIRVNKNFDKIKAQEKEEQERQNFENIKKWALRILPIVVILIIMFVIIAKHRKSQYEDEEQEENDFEDNYEEELPKSLRKNKIEDDIEPKKKSKKGKGKHSK